MRKEIHHAVCGYLTKVSKLAQLLTRCANERIKLTVSCGKCRRRNLTNVSDAERINQALKSCALGALYCRHKIFCGLFSHTLKGLDLLPGERIKVGNVADKIIFEQQLNYLRTKSVDIHSALGRKMLNTAGELSGARAISAPCRCRLVRIVKYRLTAGRAELGHLKAHLSPCSKLRNGRYHLGNYIPRLSDDNGISKHNITLVDKVKIVQSCTADGSSRKLYGR